MCALLLRDNKKGRKNYKNIFSVDEKTQAFLKKDKKNIK